MRPGPGPEPDPSNGPWRKAEARPASSRGHVTVLGTGFVLLLAAASLGLACTANTRYRILTFFFTGVPEPGATSIVEEAPTPMAHKDLADAKRQWRLSRSRRLYNHLPYVKKRCNECHILASGKLVKSVEEGLCQTCHKEFGNDLQYLHGPVAVSDCTFCHHPHGSEQPKMLYREVNSLCLLCHQVDDLTTGTHHTLDQQRPCTDCHNPHGGDDPFFLRRSEP